MKRVVLFCSLFAISVLNAEQSVYADSDYIDPEVVAKKNSREIFILKQKISQLKESIDGLKTIINGQNTQIEQLKQKIEASSNLEKIINQLSQRVATLESKGLATNSLADNNSLEKSNNQPNIKENKSTKEEKNIIKIDKKLSSKELYKKAVLDFTKSKLTTAKKEFSQLLKRSYKKAAVHFYLGEIAYKNGRYKEAITHYQKSATLDENANYMDKLLLHTAISLKNKGKNADAKVFFKAVVDGYPNSNSAKEAKKYLK